MSDPNDLHRHPDDRVLVYRHTAGPPLSEINDTLEHGHDGFLGSNTPAFFAYKRSQYGAVPVYEYLAGNPDRRRLSTDPDLLVHNRLPGWGNRRIAFYAYDSLQPGTVPIYQHPADRPDRCFYDLESDATNSEYSNVTPGVAFYAYPPKMRGYTVGDHAAEVRGLNQNGNIATLNALLGRWVLIDVCAEWCGPCNMAAQETAPWLARMNTQGVPIKLFSVLAEGGLGAPSTQGEAKQGWAVKYSLDNETVLHCNGDPYSPMRALVTQYSVANGNPEPGYPCFLLVDPKGIIRYYQLGVDDDALTGKLAELTGKKLT